MQPKPMTVTELNKYIKEKIGDDEFLQNVLIKGELSNFKAHYTGHLYFTLKDQTSLIKGIMFKTYADMLKFQPKDGMSVIIFGTISVFERDGVYQIYAKDMMLDGVGELYAKYEALKEKLDKEGLFSPTHKKMIPKYCQDIGVITSQTGSVIQDIINVSTRRNPNVHIKLIPSAVQGEGAKEQIVKAIKKFNELKNVDVIIVARGGGSLEDLWPFNEEMVAYAIYESEIPVISAVGHETDFTISDFVSDLRAPTPSAGAEIAVYDVNDVKWKLQNYSNILRSSLNKQFIEKKHRYDRVKLSKIFVTPTYIFQDKIQILDSVTKNLTSAIKEVYNESKAEFIQIATKLDTMSPLKTLERGYAVAQDANGYIIKKCANLHKDDEIDLKFVDGTITTKVI